MFVGIIKTKDILLNPRTIISMRGVKGFVKLVYRALRRKPYSFIGMTQESDWIFDQKVQDQLNAEKVAPHAPHAVHQPHATNQTHPAHPSHGPAHHHAQHKK